MGACSNCGSGGRPFAEGRESVDFGHRAHGGQLWAQRIPGGGRPTTGQGCGAAFTLTTFVGPCPECGGAHAVSPLRCSGAAAILFPGKGVRLPAE